MPSWEYLCHKKNKCPQSNESIIQFLHHWCSASAWLPLTCFRIPRSSRIPFLLLCIKSGSLSYYHPPWCYSLVMWNTASFNICCWFPGWPFFKCKRSFSQWTNALGIGALVALLPFHLTFFGSSEWLCS